MSVQADGDAMLHGVQYTGNAEALSRAHVAQARAERHALTRQAYLEHLRLLTTNGVGHEAAASDNARSLRSPSNEDDQAGTSWHSDEPWLGTHTRCTGSHSSALLGPRESLAAEGGASRNSAVHFSAHGVSNDKVATILSCKQPTHANSQNGNGVLFGSHHLPVVGNKY